VSVGLRSLRYDDLAAVLDLERSLFPDDSWSPGMFAEELAMQGRGRHYVAAEEGHKLVGYAGMMLPGGRQAEVLTLAVSTVHWGRGIGSTLLTDLLDEAGRHDCTEMILEVRADNPRAQNLYRRFGFSDVGIRRGYYQPSGMDAIVMRCGLDEPVLPDRAGPAGGAVPADSAVPADGPGPADSTGPAGGAAPAEGAR
jgi:[ribosomal protein S18]-alanine N-acetyltransferase